MWLSLLCETVEKNNNEKQGYLGPSCIIAFNLQDNPKNKHYYRYNRM